LAFKHACRTRDPVKTRLSGFGVNQDSALIRERFEGVTPGNSAGGWPLEIYFSRLNDLIQRSAFCGVYVKDSVQVSKKPHIENLARCLELLHLASEGHSNRVQAFMDQNQKLQRLVCSRCG
jgi:hypothetical protein